LHIQTYIFDSSRSCSTLTIVSQSEEFTIEKVIEREERRERGEITVRGRDGERERERERERKKE